MRHLWSFNIYLPRALAKRFKPNYTIVVPRVAMNAFWGSCLLSTWIAGTVWSIVNQRRD
jgi:hypothetical protein